MRSKTYHRMLVYGTEFGVVFLAKGRGTREAEGAVTESLVESSSTRYRASKYQIRRGRRAARSSTSQGSAEPLCARIKGANWEVSEGGADL